jgi:hypothetical protein
LQLRKGAFPPKCVAGAKRLPANKEDEMRIVETAAVSLVALAAQILVVATVLI